MDLNPLKVLLNARPDGSLCAVISDLGCSALVGSGLGGSSRLVRGLSKPGGVGLTVNYAAPELFTRLRTIQQFASQLDKRIDVYAYGVTLWEMLARREPWKIAVEDIVEDKKVNSSGQDALSQGQSAGANANRISGGAVDIVQLIAGRVMRGDRPPIDEAMAARVREAGAERLLALISACWSAAPPDRPSFSDVLVTLRRRQ